MLLGDLGHTACLQWVGLGVIITWGEWDNRGGEN